MTRSPATLDQVLLIEDSEDYAALVAAMLDDGAAAPVGVSCASTLAAAVDSLQKNLVDCVLLDLGLPDVQGADAMRTLRATAPEVPVVVLTGDSDQEVALEALRAGAEDCLVKGQTDAPALRRAIRYAVERKDLEGRLARMAYHDALTGLPNRALFLDRLDIAGARAARNGEGLVVVFLDLDNFKLVNDSLGHAAGDEILSEIARRLAEAIRPSDTLARFGGDEFTLLCEGVNSVTEAGALAERLLAAASEPVSLLGREVGLGASAGIAIGDGTEIPARLLQGADAALYASKEAGRGCWTVHDQGSHSDSLHRLELVAELRRAVSEKELRVHYQPQLQLDTGQVRGAEALVRWAHPSRGMLAAGTFIDVAEQHDEVMHGIAATVIEDACRQADAWEGRVESVAINLSPRQLSTRGSHELLGQSLDAWGIDPGRLCVEVTERAVATEPGCVAGLGALRGLGVRVSLDDFGRGHSSLAALSRLPLDELKIDRQFVSHSSAPRDAALLRGIVGLADSLELSCVAEGIESDAQRDAVTRAGCSVGQGFGLGAVLAPGELELSSAGM
jgi:diguanylate cyclase (GGDEF)-like protein